ncbi:MAG: copper-translocating P-type ATPase [Clostridia bacterium]|nr:copper-translocating P-type ATPase [Clostridia bacterium]
MTKARYSVGGMSCSACASGIERTLKRRAGVKDVTVSLMDGSMYIEYDQTLISKNDIFSIVQGLGYSIGQENTPSAKEKDKAQNKRRSECDILKTRFLISAVLLLALMYFSMGGMISLPQPPAPVGEVIQWVLSTAVLFVNFRFFTVGVRAVFKGVPNMDTLVSLGSAVSYIYSVVLVIVFWAKGGTMPMLYFESAAMIVTLVTLGKWLESRSKQRTGGEIEKLVRLIPSTATLLLPDGSHKTVFTDSLQIGDIVLVKQGDYLPVDGKILSGHAFIDTSAVTGESLPVEVQPGDAVTSAATVKSGVLRVCAERVGKQTTLAKIIQMVQEAGASKAPLQKIADKVAGIFVPAVTVIALITFIIWFSLSQNFATAMNFAVSVLVISCPCSLGLATPVAIMAATGRGAGMGILYKDAEALQKAAQINFVLLDKTATLTEGKPTVTDFLCFGDEAEVRQTVGGIESLSSHPLASCIREFCGATCQISTYRYQMGQGAIAERNGKIYRIGNRKLCEKAQGLEQGEAFLKEGKTVVYFTEDDKLLAIFAVADVLKQSSKRAVACLKERGIQVAMLTGDNPQAAAAVARMAGIDEYYADVLPQDKFNYVSAVQRTHKTVAMVGDGINDAPALKQSDVGIAVGTGTGVAIDSASIILASGDLSALSDMVALSQKTVQNIKQNLFWAFFYNVVAIPVAAGAFAFASFTLNPMIAAACMSLSSLFVVTNALRLTKFKGKNDESRQKSINY